MLNLTKVKCNALFMYSGGLLYNREKRSSNSIRGQEVGSLCSSGYKRVRIEGKQYLVHRLIFLMHYGYMPGIVDHINRNKLDNRIENLRAASRNENARNRKLHTNNTSGVKGVSWRKDVSKWVANISYENKQYHLGYFEDLELAELVVSEARDYLHKEFAHHGKSK